MRLPMNSLIAPDKLAKYLLRWRPEDDKSAFLAQAGYSLENPAILLAALQNQVMINEIEVTENTEYGPKHTVRGVLVGPNGRELRVVTIWLTEDATDRTKFITLFPDKT